MSFKIEFGKDWDTIRKSAKTDETLQRAIPDISISILKLHNTLERRITELYNIPGTLSDVMIGSSKKPEALGATFLRYNLQYRDKAIPLAKFPFTIVESASLSKAPLRKEPLGSVHWKQGKYSKDVYTLIRKGSTPSRARRGGNFDKRRGFFTGTNIKAREASATWSEFPKKSVEGTRAPYSTLYGPSLMTVANTVFDKDKQVAKAFDNMQDEILTALAESYRKGL